MIALHSPDSEGELLFLKSLLDQAGIPYFVHNERFGSLLAGPQIALYNRKTIWVHESDHEEAAALVADFLDRTAPSEPESRRRYTTLEKLRMIGEVLLFGWFLPGRRPRRGPELKLVKGFGVDPAGGAAESDPATTPRERREPT